MSVLSYNTEHDVVYPNLLEDRIHSTNNLSCNRSFIQAIENCFVRRPLHILDVGCFRGALVQGFLERGHVAVGIELCRQKEGFWKDLYEKNLFTCNVCHDFSVLTKEQGQKRCCCSKKNCVEIQVIDGNEIPLQYKLASFDLIVGINMVHLMSQETLPVFFANIRKHLKIGGLFIGSISLEDHFPQNEEIIRWQNYRLRMIEGFDFVNYPFECIPYPIFRSFYYGLVRKF